VVYVGVVLLWGLASFVVVGIRSSATLLSIELLEVVLDGVNQRARDEVCQ